MERFTFTRLPNGRPVSYSFPHSPVMEEVCKNILSGQDYRTIPFLKPSVIIDVGANVGCTSIFFAGTYPEATIYSLEPASEAYTYLHRNALPFSNIKTFNIGAYDRDTPATLYIGRCASIANSVVPNSLMGERQERVTLRRLSAFMREHAISHVSILKMDTEGVELAILRDVAPLLDGIDCIMVEYHSETDRLAIDQLLHDHFTMYASAAIHPHRGNMTYVAKHLIRERTQMDALAIAPA